LGNKALKIYEFSANFAAMKYIARHEKIPRAIPSKSQK